MLDEDVQEKGYALLCVAQPQSDCHVETIEEVAHRSQQMQSLCCGTVFCSAVNC